MPCLGWWLPSFALQPDLGLLPASTILLWYSPWLPYMFFTSAIAAGMMALIVEGFFVERWFKRGMYFDILTTLGKTAIAFAIPSAAALLYLFFAENLQWFGKQAEAQEEAALPAGAAWLAGQRSWLRAVIAHRSRLAVFVMALAVPLMVVKAQAPAAPVMEARGWEPLQIDGNRSGYVVNFPHLEHQERLVDETTGESNCQVCHHLDRPNDEATACWSCHINYCQPASIFDHSLHQQELGGNKSCQECHAQEHVRLTAEICQDCHETMMPGEGEAAFSQMAPGYKDAMHGRCLTCHQQQAVEQNKPQLTLCGTCHTYSPQETKSVLAGLTGE